MAHSTVDIASGRDVIRPLASTAGYYAAFVALGLASATLGPTLPGLAQQTSTTLSEVSILFTFRSGGYLLGSLLGGRLYDRVAGHPIMASMLLVMAITMVVTPTLPLLAILGGVLLLLGVAEGTLDVGGNTLLVWVHRSKVGPYMNGLHFFFGLGAFVAPIVVAQAIAMTGGIRWSYWVLGMLIAPIGLWLLRLPSPVDTDSHSFDTVRRSNRMITSLIIVYMFLLVGAEVSFGGWIYTYAVAMGLATETSAAYLTAVFWGALTGGRLFAIPVARFLRPRSILLLDFAGCLVSVTLLLLLPDVNLGVWIAAAGMGFAMASLFPTVLTWAERRIDLTGRTTSWFFVGASLGGMSFPWLVGQYFNVVGPQFAMWLVFGLIVADSVVFGLLMIFGGAPVGSE